MENELEKKELGQEVLTKLDALRADLGTQITEKIGAGLAELKAITAKEIEEKAKNGHADPSTKEAISRLEVMYRDLEKELLRPDGGGSRREPEVKSAGQRVFEDEDFKKWKEHGYRPRNGSKTLSIDMDGGFFPMHEGLSETKSIITLGGLGSATSGVVGFDRIPGIVQLYRQELRIRDIMTVRPTKASQIEFLRQLAFTNGASPQVEGSAKAESTITYETAISVVRTLAHWMQVSKQALDDIDSLRADIDSLLLYGLKLVEEAQILSGNGAGVNLNGIITQATAYDSGTYNVANDTPIDKIRHAILQVRLTLAPCEGIVLSPRDLHDIELVKDGDIANFGRYIVGDPKTGPEVMFLWGKPVVESDSLTYQQFVVGPFRSGARLYDRQQATIDVSFEHGTNFTENEVTIRAEERLALVVLRPASFVEGSLA